MLFLFVSFYTYGHLKNNMEHPKKIKQKKNNKKRKKKKKKKTHKT